MSTQLEGMIGRNRLTTMVNLLGKLLNESMSVLEIGSNDASFKSCFAVENWTTIDKYGNPDIRMDINGPKVKLPFNDDSLDFVLCTEVLEHLTMGTPLVTEISRCLKPGGRAIISVPNICSLKSRIKMIFGGLPNMAASGDCGHPLGGTGVLVDSHWVASHVVDFNKSRLKGYLSRGGLNINHFHNVPVQLNFSRINGGVVLVLPKWLIPVTLADFLLVEASPRPQ